MKGKRDITVRLADPFHLSAIFISSYRAAASSITGRLNLPARESMALMSQGMPI
jgi:hypothetical protein